MKRFLAAVLAAVISLPAMFSLAACNDSKAESFEECADVWSMSVTEKVMQDMEYGADQRGAAAVTFEAAKGEYENAQLILTAKTDVDGIEVETRDLVNGENVISKDNIDVAFQKYVLIDRKSSPLANFPFGMYPDAIVPLDAIQAKDEDVIAEGENQGLYFTVKTPVDCAAGTYTSTFTVKVNGFSKDIPVKLSVWDFVIPQETHAQTMFNVFRDNLIGGELDNTEEMFEKYYEFLLDYRIAVHDLPQYDDTVEGYVAQAKKYAADPRCSAYNMKFYYVGTQQVTVPGIIDKAIYETDWQAVYDRLYALAEASTPELNLLAKLYLFDSSIDEPEGTGRVADAKYKNWKFQQILAQVVADLNAENFDFEAHGLTEDDILGIEFVVTNKYSDAMPDIRTWCPQMDQFDTEDERAVYERLREADKYKTTWWYICWSPQYPYANYRIEEPLLGSRVISWMQKNYDINGFLYWGTSGYNMVGSSVDKQIRDPYTDPWSYPGSSGDGCLTYPGRPYNIDGPVSSLRLESIRAGLEDYEYLWYLEQQIEAAGEKYGKDFDFNALMSSIYGSLYNGVTPNYNGDKLLAARREVAEMIELLAGDSNAIINVSETNVADNSVNVEIYADSGTSVKINGETVTGETCGEGKLFTEKIVLTEQENYVKIELIRGDEVYVIEKFIGNKINPMALVEGDKVLMSKTDGYFTDPKEHIFLEKNTDLTDLSANAVKISLGKYETDDESATAYYSPEVSIEKNASFAGFNVADFNEFSCVVYNANATAKKLIVYLCAGSQQQKFLEVTLAPGGNVVTLKQIYVSSWTNLSKADKFTFIFEPCTAETPDVYYIDNVYFTQR